jgi:TonB family protein
MRRRVTTFLAALALAGLTLVPGPWVSAQAHSDRKVITKVAPNYPELARRMHLQGSVKLEVVVRPDGAVKSTRVIGGNPVLIQAAADALTKWKFQVVQNETTEIVQLTFQP